MKRIAERKPVTPAQIALAWLLAQEPWIVPNPGTRRVERPEENLGAETVELTYDDLREIEDAGEKIAVPRARLAERVRKRLGVRGLAEQHAPRSPALLHEGQERVHAGAQPHEVGERVLTRTQIGRVGRSARTVPRRPSFHWHTMTSSFAPETRVTVSQPGPMSVNSSSIG